MTQPGQPSAKQLSRNAEDIFARKVGILYFKDNKPVYRVKASDHNPECGFILGTEEEANKYGFFNIWEGDPNRPEHILVKKRREKHPIGSAIQVKAPDQKLNEQAAAEASARVRAEVEQSAKAERRAEKERKAAALQKEKDQRKAEKQRKAEEQQKVEALRKAEEDKKAEEKRIADEQEKAALTKRIAAFEEALADQKKAQDMEKQIAETQKELTSNLGETQKEIISLNQQLLENARLLISVSEVPPLATTLSDHEKVKLLEKRDAERERQVELINKHGIEINQRLLSALKEQDKLRRKMKNCVLILLRKMHQL